MHDLSSRSDKMPFRGGELLDPTASCTFTVRFRSRTFSKKLLRVQVLQTLQDKRFKFLKIYLVQNSTMKLLPERERIVVSLQIL